MTNVTFDPILGRLRSSDDGSGSGSGVLTDIVEEGDVVSAVSGERAIIVFDGAVSVALPFEPNDGDEVGVKVCNGRIDTVVMRNGAEIEGLDEDLTLNVPNASIVLRFISDTLQWRII